LLPPRSCLKRPQLGPASPQTVYANSTKDDGRVDQLIGSAGFDWFWAMLTGPNTDGMDALEGGEVRN